MVNCCFVYNCKNSTKKRPDLSFFQIPRDDIRQLQWLEKIGRMEYMAEDLECVSKKRVCSAHFEKSMYGGYCKLSRCAVPTLFDEGIGYKGINCNASSSSQAEVIPPKRIELNSIQIPVDSAGEAITTEQATAIETNNVNQGVDGNISNSKCKVRKLQIQVQNLQRKCARLLSPPESLPRICSEEQFLEFCHDKFNSGLAAFVESQLQLINRQPGGFRYSESFKKFALTVYFMGPKVYRFLQETFQLPHKSTLCRLTSKWNICAGTNDLIYEIVLLKIQNLNENFKDCVMCVDEMSLKTHLFYQISKDYIVGFHQNGDCRTYVPANCALALMARGLKQNWKQPLGYYYVHNTCETGYLKYIVFTAIEKLYHIGLRVRAIISDQGPNFFKLFNTICMSTENPFFYVNDFKVYYIFDPPHLLKSTRNNFFRYTLKDGNNVIEKKYVEVLYSYDKNRFNRLTPKLTEEHIHPNSFQKMRVSLAAQVLSSSVATAMETLMSFGCLSQTALSTITFISDMDVLFDILNSTSFKDSKCMRRPFKGTDAQIGHLEKMKTCFKNLKIFAGEKNVTNTIKCFRGWIITINSLLMLWNDMKHDTQFISTRYINQDCLENMFGNLRGQGGNCNNPTPIQFHNLFKKIFCTDYFRHSDGANCIAYKA